MSDHSTNPYLYPMLTPTHRRMVAASMVQTANRAVDGLLVADALDATAGGLLAVAGVEGRDTCLSILAALWCDSQAAENREDAAAADEAMDEIEAGAETVPAEDLRAEVDLAVDGGEDLPAKP